MNKTSQLELAAKLPRELIVSPKLKLIYKFQFSIHSDSHACTCPSSCMPWGGGEK